MKPEYFAWAAAGSGVSVPAPFPLHTPECVLWICQRCIRADGRPDVLLPVVWPFTGFVLIPNAAVMPWSQFCLDFHTPWNIFMGNSIFIRPFSMKKRGRGEDLYFLNSERHINRERDNDTGQSPVPFSGQYQWWESSSQRAGGSKTQAVGGALGGKLWTVCRSERWARSLSSEKPSRV